MITTDTDIDDVLQDAATIAFMDINPVNPGTAFELIHLLLGLNRQEEAKEILANLRAASPLRTYVDGEIKAHFPELL